MTKANNELKALQDFLKSKYEDTKKAVEEENKGAVDKRVLRLDVGQTKVRILPPQTGKNTPWIKKFNHMFVSNSTGKLVAYDCPTSLNMPCKICQFNSKLWDSGTKNDINMARKYKRRATYITNVYVKDNPANTEDNGQVKIFRFGQKIHDKLVASFGMVGMYYDPTSDGADFVVVKKIIKSGRDEWANYDDSAFIKGDPLHDDASKILTVLEEAYDLDEFKAKVPEGDQDLKKAFEFHILGEEAAQEVVDVVADKSEVEQKDTSEAEKPPVEPEENPEIKNFKDEENKESDEATKESDDETGFLDELIEDLENLEV